MKKSLLKVSSVLIGLAAIGTAYTLPQHTHRSKPPTSQAAKSSSQQDSSLLSDIFGGKYASAYSGYDLFINGSWINTDNALLKIAQRNSNKNTFLVSGAFQLLMSDNLKPQQSAGTNLQGMEIQTFTTIDSWVHAFTDTVTDPKQFNTTLPRAFMTFGNLNRSDYYLTIGKKEVSFGQYSTSVINVLPEVSNELGGITAKSVTLGMDNQKQRLNIRAFIYRPNVQTTDKRNVEGGIDFVKTDGNKKYYSTTGLSLVTNLADSWAISSALANHPLTHRLPAFNVRETFLIPGNNTLVAEYVSAFNHFSSVDVMTNGHAVRPGVLHIEWNRGITWLNKPVEFALGYNRTFNASAFNLPQSRFYGVATISPIRRSALSLEINADQNYSSKDNNVVGGKAVTSQDGNNHISIYLLAGIYF